MAATSRTPRYQLVGPPPGGFWRVTNWDDPFDPPPPPPPVGAVAPEADKSGRFDAPDGSFRTLYCATDPVGAIGEKLGDFALRVDLAPRIEASFVEEPDEEYAADQLYPSLDADDVASFGWLLAWAEAAPDRVLVDLWHPRTAVALLSLAGPLLRQFQLASLDRRALLDERRGFTRRLAGLIRSSTLAGGFPTAAGLRFESRLPPGWECWALWDPIPVGPEERSDSVTIDTPELLRAAGLLGVPLVR